jgi:glycerol-3-phosphate dehydrogenase (NAD(P)+)
MKTIIILGAGSWGTALAAHLSRAGHEVCLWGRDAALVAEMRIRRANTIYLPDVILPQAVCITDRLDEALTRGDYVVVAVPSHGVRHLASKTAGMLPAGSIVVSAVKGIEEGSLARMSEVLISELRVDPGRIVVLSGPSFAAEVARELPTAALAASTDAAAAAAVQHDFRGRALRLYASDDVIGVAMGARRDTLAGLSGLGDLVLTCTGGFSRNRHVGIELGHGRALDEILAGMKMVAEGVRTTHAVLGLGRRHGVELPITEKMDDVLARGKNPRLAVEELMLRPQRAEAGDGE